MAAQSAAEVIEQPAAVVETKTIPQGLTSLPALMRASRSKKPTNGWALHWKMLFQVV